MLQFITKLYYLDTWILLLVTIPRAGRSYSQSRLAFWSHVTIRHLRVYVYLVTHTVQCMFLLNSTAQHTITIHSGLSLV